ncbi:hypothetical protein [Clostridium tertium]|uniref:hypothetical protein n=1 Tax=Clostridium tertium TaxID=1559 RepID=UPI0023B28126|nr:hypothetical protein [Clostridium tertium]
MSKQSIVAKLLTVGLVCALTVKAFPPKIRNLPTELDEVEGSSIYINYPELYKVRVDNDCIELDEKNATEFKLIKNGESTIKFLSGIRKYEIKVNIQKIDGKRLYLYDKNGVPVKDISVKVGQNIFNLTKNEIIVPNSIETNSDIALVAGRGESTKQLLLARISNEVELDIKPEEPNSYMKNDRLYINLDLQEMK